MLKTTCRLGGSEDRIRIGACECETNNVDESLGGGRRAVRVCAASANCTPHAMAQDRCQRGAPGSCLHRSVLWPERVIPSASLNAEASLSAVCLPRSYYLRVPGAVAPLVSDEWIYPGAGSNFHHSLRRFDDSKTSYKPSMAYATTFPGNDRRRARISIQA